MINIAGVTYARMADSVTPAALPAGMDAYLGYADGRWPDYLDIAKVHGNVPCYGLTVLENGAAGQGTDTEPGDGTIEQSVQATRQELARGVDRPIKYYPASWAQTGVAAHTRAGIVRSRYRLLTAHYEGPTMPGAPVRGMHICGPACGFGLTEPADGTQWIDHGPWDESLLTLDFIGAATHPGPPAAAPKPPTPKPPVEEDLMYLIACEGQPTYLVIAGVVVTVPDGTDLATWEADGAKIIRVDVAQSQQFAKKAAA